jgi:hypothetical protein
MDMLDADKLLTAVTQASKDLYLGCESPHQTRRRRSERRNSPLCSKAAVQLSEDGHGGCVRACHLDGEHCLNFVFWCRGFDYSKSGINVDF